MLDIQFIRDNTELVKEKSRQKNVSVDIDRLLELDNKRRSQIQQIDDLRAQRNDLAGRTTSRPSDEDIKKGAQLKAHLAQLEQELQLVEDAYCGLLKAVPNMPTEDVPVGATENENKVVKVSGVIKNYDFKPKAHWEIGEPRDLIDRKRAAKVSGNRFVYLKGGIVQLQFALVQFVMDKLTNEHFLEEIIKENNLTVSAKPFVPVLPPMMIKTAVYEATGRLSAEETTYKLADDDLWLIASAEHSLCSMYMNEIIEQDQLPIRYLGYSTSFRREAGTYGKDTNGIIRMHHFDKLEMEVFSDSSTSLEEHKLLIAIQEKLTMLLELPYRLILKCTADIGIPNARGVDIDVWFPGQNCYKETHTADYMTDYQARDLKTRVRREDGTIELIHTNDATAFALGRIIAAIIENYQTHDGHIIVPDVLVSYMGGRKEI